MESPPRKNILANQYYIYINMHNITKSHLAPISAWGVSRFTTFFIIINMYKRGVCGMSDRIVRGPFMLLMEHPTSLH